MTFVYIYFRIFHIYFGIRDIWGYYFGKDLFENLYFLGPQQPIKISDQDEGHLKRRALLNKHFSKNKTQISQKRKQKFAISTFSIISLWDV